MENELNTTPPNTPSGPSGEPAAPPPSGMGRNIAVLVVVAIVVAAMIYAGKRNVQVSTGSTALNGQVQGKIPAGGDAIGKEAPDFTLTTLDGKQVKLSDYRGKAVMVNFWATWCGPCKIEMPWFVELHQQYAPQGFEILGVVSQDDSGRQSVASFAKDMGVNYPILLGNERDGTVENAYGGLNGLPTTFYVDRAGKIVATTPGLIGRGEIEDNIKKALASGGTTGASGGGEQGK